MQEPELAIPPVEELLEPGSMGRHLDEVRALVFEPDSDPLTPRKQLHQFASHHDALISRTLSGRLPPGTALLATGGYGRMELYPRSDIDLCVVYRNASTGVRDSVGASLQVLWDGGLPVSHTARSFENGVESIQSDLSTATSLFESRFVTGDPEVYRAFRAEVIDPGALMGTFQRGERRIREVEKRHKFYSGSPFVKEPNVKEGVGGLRDYHAVLWLESLMRWSGHVQGSVSFPWSLGRDEKWCGDILRSFNVIAQARIALHMVTGRSHDQLDLASQLEVSKYLNMQDKGDHLAVERTMHGYFLAALNISDLLEEGIQDWARGFKKKTYPASRRSLRPGVSLMGKEIFVADTVSFSGIDGLLEAVNLFRTAQSLRREVSTWARVRVREALRKNEELDLSYLALWAPFLKTFEGYGNTAATLRAMHRAGVLAVVVPEFADLTGLVRFDPYHKYAVDEHSLRAVEVIDELERGEGDSEDRQWLKKVTRPDHLKLALLLHDIGKGAGRDHVERGKILVPRILERMAIEEDAVSLIMFLVDEHLLLADTIRKGDPADPRVLENLANTVGTVERLRLLYLLTVADMKATGPAVSPRWKLSLLRALTTKCEAIMRGHREDLIAGDDETRAYILEAILDPKQREAAKNHLAMMSPRYLMEVEPGEVLQHMKWIEEKSKRGLVVEARRHAETLEIWIVTDDRNGLLTHICGAFAKEGLNILSADVFTRKDGIAMDRLRSDIPRRHRMTDQDLVSKIEQDIQTGSFDADELRSFLKERSSPFTPGPEPPAYPIEISFEEAVSGGQTRIELRGPDRRGLLFEVTAAIRELGLEIVLARIMTEEGRADDVFYVHDGGCALTPEKQKTARQALEALFR